MNYEYTVLSENNYGVMQQDKVLVQSASVPLRQSRQRETRMTRKRRLISSFSLLGNLFGGSNGFYVSSYTSIQDTLIPIEKGLLLWYRSPSIVVGIHESFSLRGL